MRENQRDPGIAELRNLVAKMVRIARKELASLEPRQVIELKARRINGRLVIDWMYDQKVRPVIMGMDLREEDWERVRTIVWPPKFKLLIDELMATENAALTSDKISGVTASQINNCFKLTGAKLGLRWNSTNRGYKLYRLSD
jgi:hypothetical protein